MHVRVEVNSTKVEHFSFLFMFDMTQIRSFIMELPGRRVVSRTSAPIDNEEEEIHDKKDIRYLKELIKNLG